MYIMDYLISYLCISILCLIWLFRRGMKLKVLDYVPYFFIFPVNIFANFAFTWFSPHYDVELWSNVYFLVIFGVFILLSGENIIALPSFPQPLILRQASPHQKKVCRRYNFNYLSFSTVDAKRGCNKAPGIQSRGLKVILFYL